MKYLNEMLLMIIFGVNTKNVKFLKMKEYQIFFYVDC